MPEPGDGRAIVTSMSFRGRALAIAALATLPVAACLQPAGAVAEVPSVDAYGGQALVLGKPRPPGSHDGSHRHGLGASRSTGSGTGESPRGGSFGGEPASGSNRAPSSAAGVRLSATGSEKVAPANAASKSLGTGAGAHARTGKASGGAGGGEAARTATLARETQPVGVSGSDLALLIAIALGLLASGAFVRVLSRRPG